MSSDDYPSCLPLNSFHDLSLPFAPAFLMDRRSGLACLVLYIPLLCLVIFLDMVFPTLFCFGWVFFLLFLGAAISCIMNMN